MLQTNTVLTLIKETFLCNRQRPLQKTTANQNAELWSQVSPDNTTLAPKAQEPLQFRGQKERMS